MTYRKKLIEVALPLDAINKESAREKSIRHGHPSTLHLWWARRPLAACRAVLFASLVDDPSNDLPEDEAKVERDRLFGILEELVKWENSNDENVLGRARAEIMRSTGGNPPPVLDPFCGGGSIPLEAQRLGLEAHGSDLNPVAVLITKALIEIPPKFAGLPPVNPDSRSKIGNEGNWRGAQGLAEDVRYYGKWMRDQAEKRIGHHYPKGPNGETVIAWLWARTVCCPNPACGARMPLMRSLWLSRSSKGKKWVEPVVNRETKEVRFEVRTGGMPPDPPKVGRGAKFRCLVCGQVADDQYIRNEGATKRMGAQLLAMVVEGPRGRTYWPAAEEQVVAAQEAVVPDDVLDTNLPAHALGFSIQLYGVNRHRDLFTQRQLLALATLSDLVNEVRNRILRDTASVKDSSAYGFSDESRDASFEYANAVATYLGLGVSKLADYNCTNATWSMSRDQAAHAFTRQALPLVWDYAEVNPFAGAAGDLSVSSQGIAGVLQRIPPASKNAVVQRQDAMRQSHELARAPLISTDPPYYDNVGYADLSDFFYVWLRRSLGNTYPYLFSTMLTPKENELIATPHRFGGSKRKGQEFFEEGLSKAFSWMQREADSSFPVTIYYAFKQFESEGNGDGLISTASTGWETMLGGLYVSCQVCKSPRAVPSPPVPLAGHQFRLLDHRFLLPLQLR